MLTILIVAGVVVGGAVGLYVLSKVASMFVTVAVGVLVVGGIIVFFWVDVGSVSGNLPPVVQDWVSLIRDDR